MCKARHISQHKQWAGEFAQERVTDQGYVNYLLVYKHKPCETQSTLFSLYTEHRRKQIERGAHGSSLPSAPFSVFCPAKAERLEGGGKRSQ